MDPTERMASTDGRPAEAIARELRQVLEKEANTAAIFGSPMKLETQTVIPVAMIEIGGGGGAGFGQGVAGDALSGLFAKAIRLVARGGGGGGGGGVSVRVRPVGFLCEESGRVVFRPIAVP
jgi:uncharacterized spore protein YtfJ